MAGTRTLSAQDPQNNLEEDRALRRRRRAGGVAPLHLQNWRKHKGGGRKRKSEKEMRRFCPHPSREPPPRGRDGHTRPAQGGLGRPQELREARRMAPAERGLWGHVSRGHESRIPRRTSGSCVLKARSLREGEQGPTAAHVTPPPAAPRQDTFLQARCSSPAGPATRTTKHPRRPPGSDRQGRARGARQEPRPTASAFSQIPRSVFPPVGNVDVWGGDMAPGAWGAGDPQG